ncbi:type IV pilus modification protein PilV [Herbaspirillum sp. SJZ099]|uniref:type IV pilus modification protein PilV n=1 Tax=Herbaspirillum sp. SJZ099 TaxID=2572916 RepID=UPI0011A99CD0|nr:type IV pilus modification protein PilV [Herbaspirillum sp. SJZ099]TWC71089.1 type IV pilus assembly protein PilV [Herbaspirillum sp. SJZ099]
MPNRSSGFTMIEVLVALLVIGTGALAMLMLQLHALRSSRDNGLQARAAIMAAELAELRAAHRAVAADSADPYLFAFDAGKTPPSTSAACASSPCDAAGFAHAAIADWRARLARDFPAARAAVCRDSGAGTPPDWRCDGNPASPVMLKLGWRRADPAAGNTPDAAPLMQLFIGH